MNGNELPIPSKPVQGTKSPQGYKFQPNEVQTTRIEQPGVGLCYVGIPALMPTEALVAWATGSMMLLSDGIAGLAAGFNIHIYIYLFIYTLYIYIYTYIAFLYPQCSINLKCKHIIWKHVNSRFDACV